jgi:hypothetical protein
MQINLKNNGELCSQGKRINEYMNITDNLSKEQKQKVLFYFMVDYVSSFKNLKLWFQKALQTPNYRESSCPVRIMKQNSI